MTIDELSYTIRQALFDNNEITAVDLIINTSGVTIDGLPPHSIEVIVTGGDDQFIADTLRDCVPVDIGVRFTKTAFVPRIVEVRR